LAGRSAASPAPAATCGTTPHGLAFLVDHTGTRRLTDQQAEAMLHAPPGVEIYFTPPSVSLSLG
jgi:hypothetical protein